MSRNAFEGHEFDWFAVDAIGHVGHFSSTGYGPIPLAILDRLDTDAAGDLLLLGQRLLQLPVIGQATGHMSGAIEDWLALARRGLFRFDWKHWCGPYRRAATPSIPLFIDAVPTDLQHYMRLIEWPSVSFADLPSVRPEDLCPCG